MSEVKKKKYTVTRYAGFTQEIYATSREEAVEGMDGIAKFVSCGDFKECHTEIENVQCPRCQRRFNHPEKQSECPHCGLQFTVKNEVL